MSRRGCHRRRPVQALPQVLLMPVLLVVCLLLLLRLMERALLLLLLLHHNHRGWLSLLLRLRLLEKPGFPCGTAVATTTPTPTAAAC